MIIKNATKKIEMSSNARILSNIFSQTRGLMFSRNKNTALIFKFEREKIISLHMFFVFYPIDVIFLDKRKVVVDKKENFRPFRFYSAKKKAKFAIEMPSGTIKKTKTGIGDKIKFSE